MLIEDDVDIAQSLSEIMQQYFIIEHTTHGSEAIKKLKTKKYHIIVSDQLLPGQITGDEILRQARQSQPETVLFLMTGIHIDEYTARLLRKQKVRLIRKPIQDYEKMIAQLRLFVTPKAS